MAQVHIYSLGKRILLPLNMKINFFHTVLLIVYLLEAQIPPPTVMVTMIIMNMGIWQIPKFWKRQEKGKRITPFSLSLE